MLQLIVLRGLVQMLQQQVELLRQAQLLVQAIWTDAIITEMVDVLTKTVLLIMELKVFAQQSQQQ